MNSRTGRLFATALPRCFAAGLMLAFAGATGVQGQGAARTSAPKAAAAPAPTGAATGPSNALQGFSQNRDQPIQIDAARLEVRDKDKVATFFGDAKGDVKVVQGDTTMRSKTLVVFYDQETQAANSKAGPGKSAKAATPGPGGSSQIRRLEAKGSVTVTQKDQVVTGENGIFDMKSNTVTMNGGVVLTQGDNVLRGERLVVDMATGVSRVEGGRVQGLFKSSPQSGGNPAAPSPPPGASGRGFPGGFPGGGTR